MYIYFFNIYWVSLDVRFGLKVFVFDRSRFVVFFEGGRGIGRLRIS